MASLKFVILAIFMAAMIGSMQAIELVGADESLTTSAGSELIEGAKRISTAGSSVTEDAKAVETLLSFCANKFIQNCEDGRKCTQIVCPSGTVQEVRSLIIIQKVVV
jgi:hypothetical protein